MRSRVSLAKHFNRIQTRRTKRLSLLRPGTASKKLKKLINSFWERMEFAGCWTIVMCWMIMLMAVLSGREVVASALRKKTLTKLVFSAFNLWQYVPFLCKLLMEMETKHKQVSNRNLIQTKIWKSWAWMKITTFQRKSISLSIFSIIPCWSPTSFRSRILTVPRRVGRSTMDSWFLKNYYKLLLQRLTYI